MSDSPGGWASPSGEPDAPAPIATPPPAYVPSYGAPQAPSYGPSYGPAAPGWQTPPGWGQPRPTEPKPGVVPLRPLGLGELLDGAVTIIRTYPRPVLGLSAAIAIITTLVHIVLALTVFKPVVAFDVNMFRGGSTATDQLDGAVGGAALGSIGNSVLTALALLVLSGVLTAVAGRGVLGEPMTLAEAWAQVRPALGRLLGIALLSSIAVYGSLMLGLVLGVLPIAALGAPGALLGVPLMIAGVAAAVYLYCRLALAPCVAVLERGGVRTSLRRSGVLVRRSWWRVFGVLLLAVIVAAMVGQVLQVPFLLFGIGRRGFTDPSFLDNGAGRLLIASYIGAGIAQTVVAPFTAGVRALLYVDRRMRAEGLDVALNAAAAQRAT